MKRAVFPGSFDPLTLGHCDIIDRSINLFDEIIVAIGNNESKKCMFTIGERKKFINTNYTNESKIKVTEYDGLTVDFCKHVIAQTNKKLTGIDTVFLLTSAKNSFISSSIVKEVISNNGDYTKLVPECVRKDYF